MTQKNLLQRSLSAIILGPVFLFFAYWSVWSYFVLFAIILVSGLNEFFNMFSSKTPELLNQKSKPKNKKAKKKLNRQENQEL